MNEIDIWIWITSIILFCLIVYKSLWWDDKKGRAVMDKKENKMDKIMSKYELEKHEYDLDRNEEWAISTSLYVQEAIISSHIALYDGIDGLIEKWRKVSLECRDTLQATTINQVVDDLKRVREGR